MLLSCSTPWGVFSADLCSAVASGFLLIAVAAVFKPVHLSVSQESGSRFSKPSKSSETP